MKMKIRKSLCASSLLNLVHGVFSKIPNTRITQKNSIPLKDHLMSGLAIFGLKFPSLLQYDRNRNDSAIKENLKNLYRINEPPSDTYLRERLDEVDPKYLRLTFKKLFALLQRGKELEDYQFLNGYYLVSGDGTGDFFSGKVSCKNCCEKKHKDGSVSYYHQMYGACIVHPDKSNVIPFCPENIKNSDGDNKNDCERNASKRFIENFRREHPHLKVIMIEDALASNGPHIKTLEENKMKYILGAKKGDHPYLFDIIENSDKTKYYEYKDEKGFLHQFSFVNDVPINKSHPNVRVNFFEYRETDPKGKEKNFSWVTNISITKNNVFQLMKGGRARWKIENETYNTLKNLGYNFKHNYGHGKQYLATVFCLLMILAFLIDQIQEISCQLFQTIRKITGSYRSLWEKMRVLFQYVKMTSWEFFYELIAQKKLLDTS